MASEVAAQAVDPASAVAAAPKTISLGKTEVTVMRDDPATPTIAAVARVAEIAGTASVVDVADVRRGRAANAEDLLSFQPGVYAQVTSGNSANK